MLMEKGQGIDRHRGKTMGRPTEDSHLQTRETISKINVANIDLEPLASDM